MIVTVIALYKRMLVYPDARLSDADTEMTLRMLAYPDARLLESVPEEMT